MNSRSFPLLLVALFSSILLFSQDSLVNSTTSKTNESKASTKNPGTEKINFDPAPIVLNADTIFWVKYAESQEDLYIRSEVINKKLQKINLTFNTSLDTIYLKVGSDIINVMYNDDLAFVVLKEDAIEHNSSLIALAENQLSAMKQNLINANKSLSWTELFIRLGYFTLSLLVLIVVLKLINWLFNKLIERLSKFERSILNKKNNLIKYFIPKKTKNIFVFLAKSARFILVVLLLLAYLPFMFSFFPMTKGIVSVFYGYIKTPILFMVYGFINFLPNLFFIIVIVIFTRYIVKVSKYFVEDIEKGKLVFNNFPKDWARTTQRMFSLLVYAFALVLIYPQIPGSTSSAFKGVSIFIGALLSFGSTSAIANMVAGVVITYMRPFHIGDRISIQGIYGDVIEKTMLVTRVLTPKMEEVTIPNANVISENLVNYSANSKVNGVIMHTSVTLGYDVPWALAEKLLLRAARRSMLLQRTPKPFVLQTSLDDNYVSHELNVYTKQEKKMPLIYSDIHRNILDVFNEEGVEILSPKFVAARDGNLTTVPGLLSKDSKSPINKLVDHLTGRNQPISKKIVDDNEDPKD